MIIPCYCIPHGYNKMDVVFILSPAFIHELQATSVGLFARGLWRSCHSFPDVLALGLFLKKEMNNERKKPNTEKGSGGSLLPLCEAHLGTWVISIAQASACTDSGSPAQQPYPCAPSVGSVELVVYRLLASFLLQIWAHSPITRKPQGRSKTQVIDRDLEGPTCAGHLREVLG